LSGILIYLLVMKINLDCVPENSFASHSTHYSKPKMKWKEKYKIYEHKDADWSVFPYICITISFADPGGILLISPERHRWLVTAVIIFEWEKQFKDVSTMIEYDLYNYHNYVRNPEKGGGFWREGVHLTLDRALQHLLVYSSTMEKKTNSSNILAKRYAANNFCVAGFPTGFSLSKTSNGNESGVLTLKFNSNFSFYRELTWLAMLSVP